MGLLWKNLPWTRSETSECAASRCPSRLEVLRPLRTVGQCRHRLLYTSSSFSFLTENISNSSRTGAHFRRGGFIPLALVFFFLTFDFGGISTPRDLVLAVLEILSSPPPSVQASVAALPGIQLVGVGDHSLLGEQREDGRVPHCQPSTQQALQGGSSQTYYIK